MGGGYGMMGMQQQMMGMQQMRPPMMGGKGMQMPPMPMMGGGMMGKGGMPPRPQGGPGPGGINPSSLAQAPPGMQKQMLGEKLHAVISRQHPDLAGKITGMMLEMGQQRAAAASREPGAAHRQDRRGASRAWRRQLR